MDFKDVYIMTGMEAVGPFAANCYILWDVLKTCVVVDPGDEPEKIIASLEAEGLEPSYIFLTHGHFDHIGAANALKEKYGCKICISELDAPMLENPKKPGGIPMDPIVPDVLFKPYDRIQIGNMRFEVLPTPGHTKGSVTYKVEDYLITGDTLFFGDIGRTDMPGGSMEDMKQSLRLYKEQRGEDNGDALDFSVLPGHGDPTTLMYEIHTNPYMMELD